jgi:hypothetical protein
MYIGDTLQNKEIDCRGCELSLAATVAQNSMTTVFVKYMYVHNLWRRLLSRRFCYGINRRGSVTVRGTGKLEHKGECGCGKCTYGLV